MTILVTGGCGFIGSNFVDYYASKFPSEKIIVMDKLTYAGSLSNISLTNGNVNFVYGDICDQRHVEDLISKERPSIIYNFAAETHVDNSIKKPFQFVKTNVIGTVTLLNAIVNSHIRFVHISTDEVFGSLDGDGGKFNTLTPYDPRSPYSASKAASDHFVEAYYHTYGIDAVITNCSNNYGPKQHIEKLIPKAISKLMTRSPVPVYGSGLNVRDWIHVDDHCDGIYKAATYGLSGHQYLFGGEVQKTNIDVVTEIVNHFGLDPKLFIEFVEDRPGHDFRYDIDTSKARSHLKWEPKREFSEALKETVRWYQNNTEWIESCRRRLLASS